MSAAAESGSEGPRAIAGSVVGHDPFDGGDAVGGEPVAGSGQELNCGDSLLIVGGFRVSQSRVAVDRGMQVDVSSPRFAPPRAVDRFGLGGLPLP